MSLFSTYNDLESSLITGDWLAEQGFRDWSPRDWNPVIGKVDYYKFIFADDNTDNHPIVKWRVQIGILYYNTNISYFSLIMGKWLNDERYQYISTAIKTRLQASMLIADIIKNYRDLAKGITSPIWTEKRLINESIQCI